MPGLPNRNDKGRLCFPLHKMQLSEYKNPIRNGITPGTDGAGDLKSVHQCVRVSVVTNLVNQQVSIPVPGCN